MGSVGIVNRSRRGRRRQRRRGLRRYATPARRSTAVIAPGTGHGVDRERHQLRFEARSEHARIHARPADTGQPPEERGLRLLRFLEQLVPECRAEPRCCVDVEPPRGEVLHDVCEEGVDVAVQLLDGIVGGIEIDIDALEETILLAGDERLVDLLLALEQVVEGSH